MSNKTIKMLQIRRIIRMIKDGSSQREISRTTNIHRRTIGEYCQRISQSDYSYEALLKLNDEELTRLVSPTERTVKPDPRRQWLEERIDNYIRELSRKGVTKLLLWEEYIAEQPDGYKYSMFSEQLNNYKSKQPSLSMERFPGERLEIDFAGHPLSYVNSKTGELIECPVLICTFTYSGFSYVEPLVSARLEHLVPALNMAMKYFDGVPKMVVSDNMAQVVVRACKYEPIFTELMNQWAEHYQTDLKATRVRKPKDKPMVEKHVDLSYQQIYARMRNEVFYDIAELKVRTLTLLDNFNDRPMYKKGKSRRERFIQEEKPLLRQLPEEPYTLMHKTHAKVKKNYHVILGEDWHQYSVPHQYVGHETDIIYDEDVVEIFLIQGMKRIAVHKRDYRRNGFSTLPEHRTEAHQKYLAQKGWDSDDFIEKAARVGEYTEKVMHWMLASKTFIEQTFDGCIGILRLGDKYGKQRLEAACTRAMKGSHINYRIVKNILENNMDKVPLSPTQLDLFIPEHENIRGPQAYK